MFAGEMEATKYRKQEIQVRISVTSLKRAGGAPDNKELVSASHCDNATLSGRSSLKSMNSPLRILSTALAGTGGRADDKTSGTALPTGAGPRLLSGVANSEAKEDIPEIGVDPPGVEETPGIDPATDINGSAPRAALVIESGTDTTGRPESVRSRHHHMTRAGVPNPKAPKWRCQRATAKKQPEGDKILAPPTGGKPGPAGPPHQPDRDSL